MNSPLSRRRARLPAALSFALSLAVFVPALAGCGNKGPLVLPEAAPPAQAVATPAAVSADAPPAAPQPAEAPPADAPPADAPPTDAPPADTPVDTPDPPRAHD